ncbi:hypothetical protein OG203_02775 [Nocardia sp. NBC_01499]|uniref:hypothetical protein n=1 Tax=Nocardia sp. NBC_01499 TaxID=2903597 RepID=UPI0038663DB4
MTIYVTHWSMTSDTTDESAYRLADKWATSWRLSWQHDRLLTREQALAGMDLAEIFSSEEYQHDAAVRVRAVVAAGLLGIPVEQVILALALRRQA